MDRDKQEIDGHRWPSDGLRLQGQVRMKLTLCPSRFVEPPARMWIVQDCVPRRQ